MPGSPWTSRWKFVLTVYVCAPADMHSAVDSFMEVWSVYVYVWEDICASMCSLVMFFWCCKVRNGWVSGYHCVFVHEVCAVKKFTLIFLSPCRTIYLC